MGHDTKVITTKMTSEGITTKMSSEVFTTKMNTVQSQEMSQEEHRRRQRASLLLTQGSWYLLSGKMSHSLLIPLYIDAEMQASLPSIVRYQWVKLNNRQKENAVLGASTTKG